MKISGSKRKGQHAAKAGHLIEKEMLNDDILIDEGQLSEKPIKPKRKKAPIILGIFFGVLVIGAASAYFFVRASLANPPPVRAGKMEQTYISPVVPNRPLIPGKPVENPGVSAEDDRISSIYTFLILASDDGNGNTDTMMVATFDTTNHTMEVVSIPRDTLVNVSWYTKKANTIFSAMRQEYGFEDAALGTAMDATIEKLADLLGFLVDYWVIVDMEAFVALIDAIDGVDFYVPINMNYEDVQAGLSIHYTQGPHHLYGKDALEVMRFRSGYANQDIGRIGTQQDFLMTAAQQILEKSSSINVSEFARLFINYVKTDIELSHLIWFGNEFLKLKMDDINFYIPEGNYSDYTEEFWYVTIYLDEWLELINDKISPYQEEIRPEDVSILTRDSNGYLYVTDGNRQGNPSWGSSRGVPYTQGSDSGIEAESAAGQGRVAPPLTSNDTPAAPGTNAAPPENPDPPDGSEPGEGEETVEGSEGLPEGEPGEFVPPEDGEEAPTETPGEPISEPVEEIPPSQEIPPENPPQPNP